MWGFDDLFNLIGDAVKNVVYFLTYPFVAFGNMILSVITDFINVFVSFFGSFYELVGSVYNLLSNTIAIIFPTPWVMLIFLGISLVVGFRLYSLLYAGAGAK